MAVTFNLSDLEFILQQIAMAEQGVPPDSPHLSFGLRQVAGTNNSSIPGQTNFGAADQGFPPVTDPYLQTVTVNLDGTIFDPNPTIAGDTATTSYTQTSGIPAIGQGWVIDSAPRTISNLIVDQSANNPAAVDAQALALSRLGTGYQNANNPASPTNVFADGSLFISNITPDNGLSAPFNSWFTFFGQFFDHGVDLITKGGNGTVFVPLAVDDPLITLGPDGVAATGDEVAPQNAFMVLTRASDVTITAGADGIMGTSDDVHTHQNTLTPFVDQSQTYSSHPSHQVFLREYATLADGAPHFTGRLLSSTAADGSLHMATWADVKANALKIGIVLNDTTDLVNMPLVLVDAYGKFIPGANGLAQLVTGAGADGLLGTGDDSTVSGTIAGGVITPITTAGAMRIGVAFLNDIAASADPVNHRGPGFLTADADSVINGDLNHNGIIDGTEVAIVAGQFDNELLNAHYIAGDGRVNENIGLTAVHEIFHSEHNRLVAQIQGMVTAELANGNVSFAQQWVIAGANLADGIDANEWNGDRLFQAAKFGTETQYQHLVFEEFARKVAPTIHLFGNNSIHLDPLITSEFANVVYRFGHSMLDENVNRYVIHQGSPGDPLNGTPEMYQAFTNAAGQQTNAAFEADGTTPTTLNALGSIGTPVMNNIGLIQAFTNPLEYLNHGANASGQIILGSVNQIGNEIDEFVTGALRNNLLGLPLDLAALNIARGRDVGVAGLNVVRNQLYSEAPTPGNDNPAYHDSNLKPYANWAEFGQFLKHAASLINFVAAYGTDVSITDATTLIDKRTAALDLVKEAQQTTSFVPGFIDNTGSSPKLTNMAFTVVASGKHTDFGFVDNITGHLTNSATDSSGAANITNTANTANPAAVDINGDPVKIIDTLGHAAPITNPDFDQAGYDFMHSAGQFANDPTHNNPLAVHTQWSTGSITGLDQVDMWIGGLAEKQNLFGGLLGSTFNYIFETQLEALQDGDRLYYLPRIEGMHFGSEIEGNSFAELIQANTGIKHLPASIFLTPEYVVEAGTVTDDTSTWLKNKDTGAFLVEKLADGTVHFIGDDNFLGNTMVLGGTAGNDRLVAGHADDDTVWGDGGNDTIDGGNGDDFLYGGDGNDYVSDSSGADVIHGDKGDDTVFAGIGDDNVFGGDGNDLIYGGAGIDGVVGGLGNDIILGGEDDDEMQGNEGDDWMEGGAGGDILVGDVGAPTGQVPLYAGNDVLDGGAEGDKMQGFSGDDIMLGEGGFDKFLGYLGFDWGSFEKETHGVDVDQNLREFIPGVGAPAGDAVRDFWTSTEGLSGSRFDDDLKGEAGSRTDALNELSNTQLIRGLQDGWNGAANFFAPGTDVHFSEGNIILGGGGSDRITGDSFKLALAVGAPAQTPPVGGGQDIIDGDAFLHVELLQGYTAGSEIWREIKFANTAATDLDTAVYNDNINNYTVTDAVGTYNANSISGRILVADAEGFVTVTHNPNNGGGGPVGVIAVNDGTDKLRNIERLQFADQAIEFNIGANVTGTLAKDVATNAAGLANRIGTVAGGALTISDLTGAIATPAAGDLLSVNNALAANFGITDADGITGPVHLQWQVQQVAHPGWVNVAGATNATWVPTDFFVGDTVRLEATYTDGLGVHEVIDSAATAILGPNTTINHAPTIKTQTSPPGLPDTSAVEDRAIAEMRLPLDAVFTDDVTPLTPGAMLFTATLAGTMTIGGVVTNVDGIVLNAPGGAANISGLFFDTATTNAAGNQVGRITSAAPGGANFSGAIDVRITATDQGGLSVQDTFRINVLPQNDGAATFSITGTTTEGQTLTVSQLAADPDGGPAAGFAFQWLRDGNVITGATSSSYTLGATDGGHTIAAQATYNDAQGFHEVVTTNAPAIAVANNGQAPLSVVGVTSAVLAEGDKIRAVLGADPDGGIAAGSAQLTWLRNGVAIGSPIAITPTNANNLVYTLVNADAGGPVISASITYTDGQGFAETVTAIAAPVAFVNNGQATWGVTGIAQVGRTLSASLTTPDVDGGQKGVAAFQWQSSTDGGTTWTNIVGATGLNYKVGVADAASQLRVNVAYIDNESHAESVSSGATAAVLGNAAPVFGAIAPAGLSIFENTLGAVAGTATDANGDPITFALAGPDAAFFNIVAGAPGAFTLAFNTAPDFEAPVHPSNTFTIDILASDGIVTTTQTVTVTVTNVAGATFNSTAGVDAGAAFTGTGEEDTFNYLATGGARINSSR